MNDNHIGKQIRIFRKKRNFSQQELASLVGVTWEMISRYERGKSSPLHKISELSSALQVSLAALLSSSADVGIMRDASVAHLNKSFIPLLASIPPSRKDLVESVENESEGRRVYNVLDENGVFAVDISEKSRIRINMRAILPKGTLICSLNIDRLDNTSIVLTTGNGVVTLEDYLEDQDQIVLAKILQWIVNFE